MSAEPLGVGIIGAGQIVKRHALAYRALPGLGRLIAVADVDPKRAADAKERFGFKYAFHDYTELLACDEVAAVSVSTPASLHARMVQDAIAAGRHVLCEKPIATTLADADAMIAASEGRPDVTASCVFQLRCDATHRRLRWMIEQNNLGRILLAKVCVRVKKSPGYYTSAPSRGSYQGDGGGVLINQAVHQLDALLWLLGEPVAASAQMDTFVHPIEAEDSLAGWIRFAGGAIATIECTTCAKKKEFSIDVVGENAGMRVAGDPDSQKFDWRIDALGSAAGKAMRSVARRGVPDPPEPGKLTASLQKFAAKVRGRDYQPSAHKGHTPLVKQFLEGARAGEPGPIPLREARRSLELATALYESADAGQVVALPLDGQCRFYRGVTRGVIERKQMDREVVARATGAGRTAGTQSHERVRG
jgi:predicted dehydrogenase